VDDSQASKNFREIIISLQTEVKEVKEENIHIKELLTRSHCNILLSIEIGKKPEVFDYQWATISEEKDG
jgi:hypothetical protein